LKLRPSALLVASSLVATWTAPVGVAGQDTLVVVADNAPAWGPSPTLAEELRIGVIEGDLDFVFGNIQAIAVDSAGVMWVADTQGPSLRRYAPDGSFLGHVGRAGEGPGEFEGLSGVQTLGPDQMAVWDAHAGRISTFDLGGTFVESISHYVGVVYAPDVFVVDDDGHFLIRGVRIPTPEDRDQPLRSLWLRLGRDGTVLDSIPLPRREIRVRGGRSYPFGHMSPFVPRRLARMDPTGTLVVVDTDDYALRRALPDGRIVEIRRSWDPVPVDPEERAQHRALARHVGSLWGPEYTDDVPDVKPPLWAFKIDEDGRYWVARHTEGYHRPETPEERERRRELIQYRGSEPPPLEWWEPLVVDVLDPRGRFLGTIRFPSNRIRVVEARGSTVWAVEHGEFDEQYVVRYRIEP
jgi:hypothetical protein